MKSGLRRRRQKAITTSVAPRIFGSISPSRIIDAVDRTTRWYECCDLGCCFDPCPAVTLGHIIACSHQLNEATA